MSYVINSHHKRFKHFIYKNIVENSRFSAKEFQKGRGSTTLKKVQASLNKIATCLNGIKPEDIPTKSLQNVSFIICNTYQKNNDNIGVGPLNDGYLFAQMSHKRGYKIFYLYDQNREDFLKYLPIFLKYTKNSLSIYYSGRCSTVNLNHYTDSAIVFNNGNITSNELNLVLSKNTNKKIKIVLICDCFTGGSIWNLAIDNKQLPSNVVSIYPIYNSTVPDVNSKAKKMHGIFTYYLSKYSNEAADISPSKLMERMNSRLNRFSISIKIESTNKTLESQSIFC